MALECKVPPGELVGSVDSLGSQATYRCARGRPRSPWASGRTWVRSRLAVSTVQFPEPTVCREKLIGVVRQTGRYLGGYARIYTRICGDSGANHH